MVMVTKKVKINKCSICQESFKGWTTSGFVVRSSTERHFEGILGPIPLALHKKCYNKLMKYENCLDLKDYND